jgi:hypothetical protein
MFLRMDLSYVRLPKMDISVTNQNYVLVSLIVVLHFRSI